MNSRSQIYELLLDRSQIDEAIQCLFNTVIVHRSMGKFILHDDGSYTMGTIGIQDVDCDFIDITYMCCSSRSLQEIINKEISLFSHRLRNDRKGYGQISLQFFQRKKSHWPFFSYENIPWEVWNLRVNLVREYTEELRTSVGLGLGEKIVDIVEIIGRDEYIPPFPAPNELSTIFNTELQDVQPYLFDISFVTSDYSPTFGDAVRRVLKTTMFS